MSYRRYESYAAIPIKRSASERKLGRASISARSCYETETRKCYAIDPPKTKPSYFAKQVGFRGQHSLLRQTRLRVIVPLSFDRWGKRASISSRTIERKTDVIFILFFLIRNFFFCIPSFRIWGHFPSFRLLGFGVIFRRSVF